MMTETEAVAVARQLLRGHHCPRCGREWITGVSVAVLMHRCVSPRQPRRRYTLPEVVDTIEDRRSELWHGFADALPGGALLRPITSEEAALLHGPGWEEEE